MDGTKVTLSAAELDLAMDPQVMLMKNAVVDAVYGLFGRVAERQSEILSPLRPFFGEAFDLPPKISRGEKYRGLPYVMLDHPRSFTSHDILAVRTLFWWGHFFSVTLHLRGRWLERFEPGILASRARLAAGGFHVSTGAQEWEHHFGSDNYRPVESVGEEEWKGGFSDPGFVKLALRHPISRFAELEDLLVQGFGDAIGILYLSS
jgi:hypothetical protein